MATSLPAREEQPLSVVPLVLLGLGLGALLDEIVLQQLLGWHHSLSSSRGAQQARADGVLALGGWAVAVLGVVLTAFSWRHGRRPPGGASLSGLLLLGWGLVGLVDVTVVHGLLGLHHVRDDLGGPATWELGYLAVALLQVALGWWLHLVGGARHGLVVVQVRLPLASAEVTGGEVSGGEAARSDATTKG